MSKKEKQKIYDMRLTKNSNRTRVLVGWDNGERCITETKNNPFWANNNLTKLF